MQYNASQDVKVVRRYFIGLTVLRKGQILCYQEDASKTDADPKLRLGHACEVINADNLKFLAGVVSDSDSGKTGPCFVELLQPQSVDVVDAETDGTTNIAVGDLLELDDTLGALVNGAPAFGQVAFIALEANTADAAKTIIRVQKV